MKAREMFEELGYEQFDFKQGIISHCRQIDKADVYEWIAEDELKIQQLQSNWNELKKWLEEEIKSWEEAINEERDYELVNEFASRCNNFEEILNKMQELERGEE